MSNGSTAWEKKYEILLLIHDETRKKWIMLISLSMSRPIHSSHSYIT